MKLHNKLIGLSFSNKIKIKITFFFYFKFLIQHNCFHVFIYLQSMYRDGTRSAGGTRVSGFISTNINININGITEPGRYVHLFYLQTIGVILMLNCTIQFRADKNSGLNLDFFTLLMIIIHYYCSVFHDNLSIIMNNLW